MAISVLPHQTKKILRCCEVWQLNDHTDLPTNSTELVVPVLEGMATQRDTRQCQTRPSYAEMSISQNDPLENNELGMRQNVEAVVAEAD